MMAAVNRRVVAAVAIAVAAAVLALVIGWLAIGRPAVRADSTAMPAVVVECAGSTGVSSATCAAWGDDILSDGGPSSTFDMDDLARLELRRGAWGFGGECEAAYFIGRYPDDAVWTEEVPCVGD